MGMGGWIGFWDTKREEIGCPEGKYGYDNGFHTSCIATPKRETVVFFMDFMDSRTREYILERNSKWSSIQISSISIIREVRFGHP